MPRPLKSVPADTLGGKIRAARQRLHLSLSQVAGTEYSTSLISQIERNKIEPSTESLHYLAKRLNLSFDDLNVLAQQRRELEAETSKYQRFEDQRQLAAQLLDLNQPRQALKQIASLVFTEIPTTLRWRIVALQGQCYFTTRQFKLALRDFLAATAFLPYPVPQDQMMEVVQLRLHLAATLRELGQYDAAYDQYALARSIMDASTPLRYIAEAHWGTSLVVYELAYRSEAAQSAESDENDTPAAAEVSTSFRRSMEEARSHAENARSMYRSANEWMRASLLDCHISLIEHALHKYDSARARLQAILDDWLPTLAETVDEPGAKGEVHAQAAATRPVSQSSLPELLEQRKRYTLKERANIVSAAACYLASIERETGLPEAALEHVNLALQIGERAYLVRRADAYMTRGQIFADCNDPQAIEEYKMALDVLKATDRLGAIIRIHKMLGAQYMRLGMKDKGEAELEIALQLADVPAQYSATAADEYSQFASQG